MVGGGPGFLIISCGCKAARNHDPVRQKFAPLLAGAVYTLHEPDGPIDQMKLDAKIVKSLVRFSSVRQGCRHNRIVASESK
jgi:hypothetical protein